MPLRRSVRHVTLAALAALLLVVGAGRPAAQEAELPPGLYARLETSRGTIVAKLYHERVPMTVGSFVGLAEGDLPSRAGDGLWHYIHFYDGLRFHRVLPGLLAQTGDPAGNGLGGPGYTFPDEVHPELRLDRPGVLAMANAGPDANGSQFFLTRRPLPWLDGQHTVFGQVVRGMAVVNALRGGDALERVEILRIGPSAAAFEAAEAFRQAYRARTGQPAPF